MFVVQISLLVITFISFVSQILPLMQATKEVNPHPRIVPCVDVWSATFFDFMVLETNLAISYIDVNGIVNQIHCIDKPI